jgi:hypothetical protein
MNVEQLVERESPCTLHKVDAKVITRSTGKATDSLIPEGKDGYRIGCFFADNFIMPQ